jgi:RNA polymerase sigma factor (sigma-70 family)
MCCVAATSGRTERLYCGGWSVQTDMEVAALSQPNVSGRRAALRGNASTRRARGLRRAREPWLRLSEEAMGGELIDPAKDGGLLRHYQEIFEELSRIAGCPHMGADLSQETYCRAFRALARGVEPRNNVAWLLAIGRNVARDHLRRMSMRAATERRAIEESGESMEGDGGPEATPFGIDATTLFQSVNDLPPRARALIIGFYLEGKGCEALGIELGISRNHVKCCLHRARKRLRGLLDKMRTGAE